MGENNLSIFLVFLFLFVFFVGFYGVYIIPKLLIEVPGHIQELPKLSPNLASYTSFFITELLQTIQEIMESSLENIISSYLNILELQKIKISDTTGEVFLEIWWVQKTLYLRAFSKNFRAWNFGILGQSFFENIKT